MRPIPHFPSSLYGGVLVLTGVIEEKEKRVVFAFGVNESYSL
jgi:hypothetical protein